MLGNNVMPSRVPWNRKNPVKEKKNMNEKMILRTTNESLRSITTNLRLALIVGKYISTTIGFMKLLY
jgi:hypothetical protein